jgi:tRNA nucleotidyltransferase (CCA-adding enzyme)
MVEFVIPKAAKQIIDVLQENGYEAYIVGGCVRDLLLGREPKDWDITTSALPKEVKALFRRTIDTGIEHGTVTIMMDKVGYEVTTYRVDGDYEDGRHPKEVTFTPSLSEDLKRRDFTINAMAYNPKDGLVDLFDGIKDLKDKRICCVGSPVERFNEDALRMMRAVRFAAQLGFTIEKETFGAIQKLAPNLKKISAERIQVELSKLLTSNHPELFRLLYESKITSIVLPEFDACVGEAQNCRYHCYDISEHILKAVESTPPVLHLRLAALFHDIGKPVVKTTDEKGADHFKNHAQVSATMTKAILKRLKYDNDTLRKVVHLIEYHDCFLRSSKPELRKMIHKVGLEAFPDLLILMRADALAKHPDYIEESLGDLDKVEEAYHQILEAKECLSLKELALNGNDLKELGIAPGKQIGEMLNRLLAQVLENPNMNTREILEKKVQEWK